MSFFEYLFSFLYVRNWETGQRELSATRLYAFIVGIVIVGVALLMVYVLQRPIIYTPETLTS